MVVSTALLSPTIHCQPAANAQALPGTWTCALNEQSHGISASTRGSVVFAKSGGLSGAGGLNIAQSDMNASLEYRVQGTGSWSLKDQTLAIRVQNWTYTPTNMLAGFAPDAPRELLPKDLNAEFLIDQLSAKELVGRTQPEGLIVRCSRP